MSGTPTIREAIKQAMQSISAEDRADVASWDSCSALSSVAREVQYDLGERRMPKSVRKARERAAQEAKAARLAQEKASQ